MSIPDPADALLDTNVLTGYTDLDHVQHERLVRFLHETDLRLYVAPQSLYEFWAVATRPRNVNGLAMLPQRAARSVVDFRRAFTARPDPPGLLDEWLNLCRTHGVSGKNAHDARLAAYARLHGITRFVTLNPRDFARYGLTVVAP